MVDEETPAGEVIDVLTTAGGDLVEKVELFDVFRGEQVGEGKKSLALAFQFRAADRTLSAEDIAQVRNRIIATAEKVLHAQLRS